jgi:lipid A 3-O-deacylase
MPAQIASRLLVCLAVLGLWAGTGHAEGLIRELRGGVLAHDVPGLWSGFRTEKDAVAINIEAILSPSMPFLGGTIRPAIGASIATNGGTSNAYFDARWEIETSTGIFFSVGLGGTIHNGETDLLAPNQTAKALGSHLLFHIPIEIGYRFDARNSVSVYFEHMSNAYTQDRNEGLDRLGVRYGRRF